MRKNDYFERKIDSALFSWAKEKSRKPLLLRGARQVGKSSAVRNLGKTFKNYVEINFEYNTEVHIFFEKFNSPHEICKQLSLFYKTEITAGQTLVFFDEIQDCPKALAKLRYFYEKYQELHLIAAGSLLEFAIEEIPSFAVGRIRSLYLYPFSFEEFLLAQKNEMLIKAYRQANSKNPLSEPVHNELNKLLKTFLIIGAMPEAVAKYIETESFLESQMAIDDLITSLKSDFKKYKKRVPPAHIENVFESIASQAGGKFVYEHVSNLNNLQVKQALELLIMAGLAIPVAHSSANGIPIGAEANYKHRKMLLLDTGIFLRMLDFNASQIIIADDFKTINMGSLAEMFVGLEILKASSCYMPYKLYCWHREKKQSNAQVDYVIQKNNSIVPIEVKSGLKGAMPSLRLFMQEKNSKIGIRTSLENFGKIDNIEIYPLYAISNIF
ncbi:MAG: ATP-binding protein [Fibromonadaceae bacterium]|jgi:predicted AAA+ superfamily ATPase|nr:ATP-binding protein [Fibromonadaceae bacterium]